MATELTMPKLGLTMVDGKIVEWKKKEGEAVQKGEILFVIETEKVTYEFEAPVGGTLGRILVSEGETVVVGTVVSHILQPGETASELPTPMAETKPAAAPLGSGTASAGDEAYVLVQKSTSGDQGKDRIKISPVARKMAEECRLDIARIVGTGPEGRIVKEDIEKAVAQAKSKPTVKQAAPAQVSAGKVTLKPLSGMRRTIARRMSQSFQTIPHFWFQATTDVTKIKELRERLLPLIEAKTGLRLTLTDVLIRITARTLEELPIFNSRWTDNGIELIGDINIGVATGVADGLLVPVIRNANRKSLEEITVIRSDLVKRARAGKLGIDELTGSTFTINNFGTTPGIIGGNTIINPPEVAILAFASIGEQPVVFNGQIVARSIMNMTMAADHRVLDGVVVGQFLGRVKQLIENPLLLL
jgi:pyruvate dehydrogenase E2 component (dihydrolipoamide acetyltransferase)